MSEEPDYPTMQEFLTTDPTRWDLSMTFFTGAIVSPGQVLWLTDAWPGEYSSAELDRLQAEFQLSTSAEEATEVVDALHELVWTDLPTIQLGAVAQVGVYSASLTFPNSWTTVLWNVQIEP